jgi:hypothetical protein
MQPQYRQVVAFLAASLHNASVNNASSDASADARGGTPTIIDLTSNEECSFDGELSRARVVIANRDGSYFTGTDDSGVLSILDHATEHFFTFEHNGERFWGFDYATNTYYSGQLDGDVIRIADEESNHHFSYAIRSS